MNKFGGYDILRRIVPWASESSCSKMKHRLNYKGNRGRIGVVGGARDYAGAPYFASISAMRLGADLAYVICSRAASQAIKNYSPDLIITPLLDCPNDSEFETEMDCLLSRLHALVIGPGLGREHIMQSRAKRLIEKAKAISLPLVLDADSLILINEDPSIIKSYSRALLTPNRVELQRLLNVIYSPKIFDLRNMHLKEVENLVKQCSSDLDVSILVKGTADIICDQSGFIMQTDQMLGSNRRCGGQGDILSGIAGVYIHWIEQYNKNSKDEKVHRSLVWAGYLAAVTTRLCNQLAFDEFSNGMLASHMVEKLHVVLNSMLCSKEDTIDIGKKSDGMNYVGSMTQEEINRYRRQMIMDEFGPDRQLKLKQASAIIIGAGGLGCPAAVYLAAGGIGRLGLVDDDKIEVSNLHRQILHNVRRVGTLKTESIKKSIQAINPILEVETYPVRMNRFNAVKLIEGYDIVIDATDNLKARYMISDACVVAKKPLVSGAALKMDGQLTVYNYDEETPCFRCLFPEPPPADSVGSCSDIGVLGVIPGVIGTHQALEAIKLGAGLKPAYAGKMLLFDGQLGLFRQVTLGKRKPDCRACGPGASLNEELIDYDDLCGTKKCDRPNVQNNILSADERISAKEYRDILKCKKIPHVLIDVRPRAHSDVSRLSHALQIPLTELVSDSKDSFETISLELKKQETNLIYVVCRRGISSQRAVRMIERMFNNDECENQNRAQVKDIIGGMTGWAELEKDYACL